MRSAQLVALLVSCSCLTALHVAAEEDGKVAANIYNQATDDLLIAPARFNDGHKSRIVTDKDARTGFAMLADPADKPGAGIMWFGYTYNQGAGRIRATFRLKVADNTIDKPVVHFRGFINNCELKSGHRAERYVKGTDFKAANTYQEFSIEFTKGEQGFGDWAVSTMGLTRVWSDGVSVEQLSMLSTAELVKLIEPPVKPAGLTLSARPFRVHETHGLFMEMWQVKPALGLLPAAVRADAGWTQSYLIVHPQKYAVIGFPGEWEDLYKQRAIILNNTPAKAVGIVRILMLKRYVEDGGTIVLMGDTHGLAPGGWYRSALGPLLPVTPQGAEDLVRPATPVVLSPSAGVMRKAQLDWSAKPYTIYVHKTRAKPTATILVAGDGFPLVVEGRVGKGRIVVMLCSAFGEEVRGSQGTPFWKWKDWPALMARVLAAE